MFNSTIFFGKIPFIKSGFRSPSPPTKHKIQASNVWRAKFKLPSNQFERMTYFIYLKLSISISRDWSHRVRTAAETDECARSINHRVRPAVVHFYNAPTTCPITHRRWEYLIEVQRAGGVGGGGPIIWRDGIMHMCLHCGRMRYKCNGHSSATPAVRMDNCTADSEPIMCQRQNNGACSSVI